MTATAQVIELPHVVRMRQRLAELEAVAAAPPAPVPEPIPDQREEVARLNAVAFHMAQMVAAVSSSVDGLEEMCNVEKARADEAELMLAMANAGAQKSLDQISERDRRLAHVAEELAGLRRQIADARAENESLIEGKAVETGLLRQTITRLQADLERAQARAKAAEAELEQVRAERDRNKTMARDVALACATFAESRAEGFAIGQDIRNGLAKAWAP